MGWEVIFVFKNGNSGEDDVMSGIGSQKECDPCQNLAIEALDS